MYLADTAIKRPVFATMVITALVVLGLASYSRMSIELLPNIEFPVVVITTIYPGASSEAVASDVTKPIEDAVNTIAGVKRIRSTSRESISQVVIEFTLETNADIAAQDVRDKMAAIIPQLPTDVESPVVQRFNIGQLPVMTVAVWGERSEKELTSFAKNFLKRRLETVPGVGVVQLVGGSEREIQILLDLDRMEASGVTASEVAAAVVMGNVELPSGKIKQETSDLMVRVMGRARSAEEISSLVVKNIDSKIIRVGDVAQVVDGVKEKTSLSRLNDRPAVSLEVIKQSGANVVATADGIKKRLSEIAREIPSGVNVEVVEDNSIFIRESVADVTVNLIYGGILAVAVIFLFLANVRSTLISALAIPTSIVGTFFLMNLFGFTINVMTLMGLSLAVGLLIDDAIVVIENIYRHLDEGESPVEAARNATAEIGLAVTATTFSIVVVFLPVAFMSGIVGRFFYQFGITVAGAVLISLFVAFTLTPMLSSRWLKKEQPLTVTRKGVIYLPVNFVKAILRGWNDAFRRFAVRYHTTLEWALSHRRATLAIATVLFVAAVAAGGFIGQQFFPETDESKLVVSFRAAPDASLEQTAQKVRLIEKHLQTYPEVVSVLTKIGGEQIPVNEGNVIVNLKPKNQRSRSVFELIPLVRRGLSQIAGLSIQVAREEQRGQSNQEVEYTVRGPEAKVVKALAQQLEDIIRQAPGAVDVTNSERLARPELRIHVDRELANDLGVKVGALAQTVRNLVDGVVVSRFKEAEEEYDIRMQLAPEYRTRIDDIARVKIESAKRSNGGGQLVRVGDVAKLELAVAPSDVRRYNRQRAITVGCNLAEGYVFSDVAKYVNARLAEMNIPPGYDISVVGMGEIMAESFANIFMALVLAIIFIYLLLASQFESFVDPLAIMLSLPLAVVGALFLLLIWKSTISIISLIGIVLLMGLVTKNAILLIDFTKQLRRRGVSRSDALLRAGPIRLRPILMTTFAMIFGMLPLALGVGPGAELRAPMARAIIGGLISSTLLTLVVVPVVYTVLDDAAAWITQRLALRPMREQELGAGPPPAVEPTRE